MPNDAATGEHPAMRLASLAMYGTHPAVEAANDALWAAIAARLKADGIDAPDRLDRSVVYHDAWLRPDLLLAQTCGLPYVARLRGKVRLLGTPVYDFPGGDGPMRRSVVIVRADDPATTLADLRGRRAAINEPLSNSGVNLWRIALAPLARNGRFFGSVIQSGGHLSSIDMVRENIADAASIDSVTWGQTLRHAPARVAGLRILTETPTETAAAPGLPLITRLAADDREVEAITRAVEGAIADPALADARAALGLTGFARLTDADYQIIEDYARRAEALGYPMIA